MDLKLTKDKINEAITEGYPSSSKTSMMAWVVLPIVALIPVVMARALQAVKAPDILLLDMLRVAREAVITFLTLPIGKTACI